MSCIILDCNIVINSPSLSYYWCNGRCRTVYHDIYNDNCVWSFRWFPACCWPLVCCAVVCPSPPPPGSSLTGDRRDCGQTACPPRGTSCPTSAEPTSPGVSIHRQYAVGRGLGGWAGVPPGSLSMSTCSPHETIFLNLDIYY